MYIYKRRISTFCFTAINKFTLEVSAQFGSKKLYNKNYQNYQIFFELHQLFIHYFLYNTVSFFPLLILLTRRITKTIFHQVNCFISLFSSSGMRRFRCLEVCHAKVINSLHKYF